MDISFNFMVKQLGGIMSPYSCFRNVSLKRLGVLWFESSSTVLSVSLVFPCICPNHLPMSLACDCDYAILNLGKPSKASHVYSCEGLAYILVPLVYALNTH
jgi:hypothetical protein